MTETLSDWVSWADQLSVVEVIAEHRGEPDPLAPGERTKWVGRKLDFRVLDTTWRRDQAPTAPETFSAHVDPWLLRDGKLSRLKVSEGPWLEIGQRYLTGVVRFDEGDWGPFPRSTMPLAAAGVVVPTCPNHHATLATFTGMTPAEAGAVLANTAPDPASVELAALPPVERWNQAVKRRPPEPQAVVDFVCESDGTAHTYTRAEGATAPDGVHLRIANLTGNPLVFGYEHAGGGGGRQVPPGETDLVVLAPPGPLLLRCGQDSETKKAPAATVEIHDTGGHYRNVDVEKALGCKITTRISDWQVGPLVTAADALAALVAPLGGKITTAAGPGYRTAAHQTYLLHKDGHGYGLAETSRVDGGYVAALTQQC